MVELSCCCSPWMEVLFIYHYFSIFPPCEGGSRLLWNKKKKESHFAFPFFFEEKPKLKDVNQEVRTVPSHYIWCTAEGTPPINISLLQSFTNLALRVGLVYSKIQKTGNFTCRARNEAGTDSRDFSVVIGKNIELT